MEKFKKGINRTIHQRLMESKQQSTSIEQWFNKTIALDRNWRKSRRKIEVKIRAEATDSKTKLKRDIMAINTKALDIAKEAEGSLIAGVDRAYSNKRSREDKCSYSAS